MVIYRHPVHFMQWSELSCNVLGPPVRCEEGGLRLVKRENFVQSSQSTSGWIVKNTKGLADIQEETEAAVKYVL